MRGTVAFFQGVGGGVTKDRALRFPLALLASGPAAGALGAASLAKRMSARDVIIADMGGTSFDAGVIRNNEIHIERDISIGPFKTQVNLVDVVSIGQGGGSIASISERGVPQVGPRSAGAVPGPACYDRGGHDPTVTDAMLVMGFIDPDNYLGGRLHIRKELAAGALDSVFGRSFGWTAEESGAAVHDLVVANMSNSLHEVTVRRGYDPRDFLCVAYGGTLPLFAWQIAAAANVEQVVIPQNSSVFCAQGLLSSDFVIRLDQTVSWNLAKAEDVDRVNSISTEMVASAVSEMRSEGFADSEIEVARSGDFRFIGQVYELSLALPDSLLQPDDAPRLLGEFKTVYEASYGQGSAWRDVPAMLVNYTVTAIGRRPRDGHLYPEAAVEPGDMLKGVRDVYLPSERCVASLPIYDGRLFLTGSRVEGPAIIDETDSTIYIPRGVVGARDEFMNYRLSSANE